MADRPDPQHDRTAGRIVPRAPVAPVLPPAIPAAPSGDWAFYVVESAFIVRQDRETDLAERLLRDGRWVPFRDLPDLIHNGRSIPGEAEAMSLAKRLFAKYPELP